MNAEEFIQSRHYLGKSQSQMAEMLSVSTKAVQSFEQDWRNVPASVERQLMFLLYLTRKSSLGEMKNCWETIGCPDEWKKKCNAWECGEGHLCWFVNGNLCRGQSQSDWKHKMDICHNCEVLRSLMPPYFKLISCFLLFSLVSTGLPLKLF